ncbi:cyclic pyranopterin monophosphate synthase subunit MoaA [Bellilinea caldifistulae]|uniref:GTP 3',8-cyclase n=1 Tax=Bellilinea caldifistulae TaxID=360411 RepID=A0A0P6XG72_9CHLR|nr:GTP 3',8-cyclase MoaA [Bellilinea caldifistulae]KPL74246.1 molybdenum cofactor biosynthesis protein MoeA [Bellilinea caldifistulae]GAP10447.1 cyclic pyranopterin monophosphate synthase subunit MoaA [Bellilinea caldifistulae]
MLTDPFGRQITYLRISVTDRCNFRCVYCMPPQGVPHVPHERIMRYEEIAAFVQVAARQGIRKVRLTGGEPLVRADIPRLVEMISAIEGIEDISLTTNGILLEKYAGALAQAGLKRVNVSLDTLNAEKFACITRGGELEKVLRGIAAAEAYGLTPIKINTVIMRGINDDELVDLAKLTLSHPWNLRFIELMPIENQRPWGEGFPPPEDIFMPVSEVMDILQPLGLHPVELSGDSGPAIPYRLVGGVGTVGFISPLTEQHFCQRCNRIRLTADGHLRPCLMSDAEIPILPALRAGEPVLPLLQEAVNKKPVSHQLAYHISPNGRCMIQIGG